MKSKIRLGYLFIPIILLLLSVFFYSAFLKKTPFDTFCNNLFLEELSDDTLSLHYTLAHPGKYGIRENTVSLPLYSKENALSDYQNIKQLYEKLLDFNIKDLSKDEKYTYRLLANAFSHELKGKDYYYLQEVFSPSAGIQLQFPILMAEYPFRSKDDIENYLKLLILTPDYFESLCQFEKEKVSRGFGMADYSLNKVIDQCLFIMDENSIQSNEHFLISTFNEKIATAVSQKIITKKEAGNFIETNKEILFTHVVPAYKTLTQTLSAFTGQGKNENGLSHFADGQSYYEWLFKTSTGSDTPIENVYKILATDYYNTMDTLEKKLALFQSTSTLTSEELSFFPLTDSDEILSDLQKQMSADFPSLISSFNIPQLPATVKDVSPALENYTAPAYYMIPPIDDHTINSIYINRKTVPSGLDLYTTLAHEGYPGHLYQTTYYQTYCNKNEISPLRNILNYGGYVEGWALYTEFLSYSYASELLTAKTGKEDYRLLYKIYELERKASLSMLTLLDIGIHYYSLDYERTKELLTSHGIYSEEDAREIYEYIVEEPTTYAKYYWGYLQILALKESAQKQMGEFYSDYAFHTFFLECGPSDFTTLQAKLKEE